MRNLESGFLVSLSENVLVLAYREFFLTKDRPLSLDHATCSDASEYADLVFKFSTGLSPVRHHELSECINPQWCMSKLRGLRKEGKLPKRSELRKELEELQNDNV